MASFSQLAVVLHLECIGLLAGGVHGIPGMEILGYWYISSSGFDLHDGGHSLRCLITALGPHGGVSMGGNGGMGYLHALQP